MSDLILDGHEITFDLTKVKLHEHRALIDPFQPIEEEDDFACKVSGLTLEAYKSLNMLDIKRFWEAYYKKVREPLANPN